jgi:hypothetical protein
LRYFWRDQWQLVSALCATLLLLLLCLLCWGYVARGVKGADLFEEAGGGLAGNNINADNLAASGFDFFTADDLIAGPVATFDKDIRQELGNYVLRCQFRENQDGIDTFEAGKDFGAFLFGEDRTRRAFEAAHAGIAIDANDEKVTEGAGGFETLDVAGMKKIEATVGEDQAPAVAFLLGETENCFVEGKNGLVHIVEEKRLTQWTQRSGYRGHEVWSY